MKGWVYSAETYAAAKELAENLCRGIAAKAIPHAASLIAESVTVSIGVAGARITGEINAERLVRAADQALYRSKEGGTNRVTLAGGI